MQADKEAELHVCFRRSYDVVLKHHHSFIVRSVVTVSYLPPSEDEMAIEDRVGSRSRSGLCHIAATSTIV